jgi:hypothetical protein
LSFLGNQSLYLSGLKFFGLIWEDTLGDKTVKKGKCGYQKRQGSGYPLAGVTVLGTRRLWELTTFVVLAWEIVTQDFILQ